MLSCEALGRCAGNGACQLRILERGGVDVVIAALRAHPQIADVPTGCFALGFLSRDSDEAELAQKLLKDSSLAPRLARKKLKELAPLREQQRDAARCLADAVRDRERAATRG